ncbi:MAG: hypothetical protein J7J51_05825 [Candidatus Omnitrophica bacterium]|nr:hypothetical protein [Candidatus Omnitrophota bacterium]
MRDIFKRNRIAAFFLLLILLLSATVTVLNLGWHKTFAGEDYGFGYDFPGRLMDLAYYNWDSFLAPGKIAVTTCIAFLWTNLIFILFKLGLSSILIERIVYFLFFAISGTGVFFLLTILIGKYCNISDSKTIYLGAFTGSLLYMFNHFSMYTASYPISPYHLSYMLLPLVVALFIYNLQIKTSLASTSLFLVTFLFLANSNPANTLSIAFFLIAYFLFFIWQTKENLTNPTLFIATSFILILLLCSYIYLPMLAIKSNLYGKMDFTADFLNSLYCNSSQTSFLNLFRLAGVNIWANFSYYHLYMHNVFFIVLGYLIPVLAIVSLFIPNGKKVKIFFGLIVIIALYFAKGAHSPFEKLFLFLFAKVPFFEMYRAVYHKFVFFIALSYSVLIALFVSQLYAYLRNHYRKIKYIIVSIPLIVGIYGCPFFTNDIVQYHQGDVLTVIPEEYRQVAGVVKKDLSDFKILSVPPAPEGAGLLLQWQNGNRYVGPHPDWFFLDSPVLDSYWFIANGLIEGDSWADMKFENNVDSVLDYTKLLNIKYIFLHKDFVEKYDFKFGGGLKVLKGNLKAKIIEPILERQKGIEITRDSRYYVLYELSDEYFLPHIYPSTTPTIVTGDIETLMPMTETKYLDGKPVLVFVNQIPDTGYKMPVKEANNFVFKDTGWKDLAVEMIYCLSLMANGKEKIKVEKTGTYEFWLDTSELEEIPEFEIEIDGELVHSSWLPEGFRQVGTYGAGIVHSKNRKYIKVGEVEMEEGEHKVEAHSSWFIAHSKDEKSRLVLVNGEEREHIEEIIWQKINNPETEVAYIFSQDGEFYVP